MKKLTLPSFKIRLETILHITPFITLGTSLVLTLYVAWFIYNNIVIASNDAVALQSISQHVVQTRLNTNLFEEVNQDFSKKKEGILIDVDTLRNPFKEDGQLIYAQDQQESPEQSSQENQ